MFINTIVTIVIIFIPIINFLIIITVSAPLFSNSRVASKAPSGPTSSAPDNQDEDQENDEEEEKKEEKKMMM